MASISIGCDAKCWLAYSPGAGARWLRSWVWPKCSRVARFDCEVIVLCVRCYLRFKLSFRDLVEMMAEHGLSMVYTSLMRLGASLCTRV